MPSLGQGPHLGEGQGQADLHVHATQTIGADHAQVVFFQEGPHLISQDPTTLAHFGKPGGLHHHPRDAQLPAVLDQRRDKAGRSQDYRQVHRLGQVPEARVDGQAEGGAGPAAHQENLPLILELQQIVDDSLAQVVGGVGDSHHRQTFGIKEFFHGCPGTPYLLSFRNDIKYMD